LFRLEGCKKEGKGGIELFWVLIILVGGLIMIGYMFALAEHDQTEVKKLSYDRFKVGESQPSIKLFFISDIHNRKVRSKSIENVDKVDVVIIGGDLVDKRTPYHRLMENLQLLKKWNAPIFFIPGNNDHELKNGSIIEVLENNGVKTLSNEDEYVNLAGNRGFVLSGLDPYFTKPNRSATQIKDSNFLQVLCVHDPFVYQRMNQEDKERFDLVLAGHTHGGQIRIFGLGPYERGGWLNDEDQPLLVSEGYGTSLVPLRLGTRAECHVIHLNLGEQRP
jgi:uncharacterized protein